MLRTTDALVRGIRATGKVQTTEFTAVSSPEPNFGVNWGAPGPFLDLEESQSKAGNPLVRALHALRRKWLIVLVLGTIVGTGAAFGVYQIVELEYTAVTRLLMPRPDAVLPDEQNDPLGYETYRTNQVQLITGPEVLSSALVRVGSQRLVLAQEDPLVWMMDGVSASFPENSDILTINFRCSEQRAATEISEAILATYLDEILLVDLHRDEDHKAKVVDEADKVREEFKRKQSQLIGLEDVHNGTESNLTPAQAIARSQLLSELEKVKTTLRELKLQKSLVDRLQSDANSQDPEGGSSEAPAASETELDAQLELLMAQNVEVQDLKRGIRAIEGKAEREKKNLRPDIRELYLQVYSEQIQEKEARISQIEQDYRRQIALQLDVGPLQTDNRRDLDAEIQYYEELQTVLTSDLEQLPEPPPVVPATRSSELELLRLDVETLRSLLSRLEQELDATQMAINNSPFKHFVERLDVNPPKPIVTASADQRRRLMTCGASGVLAFLMVGAIVVLLDLRIQRLNTADQIPEQLKLNVIGSIPLLRRNNRSAESSSRLAEAVDGVAAALLCQTTGDDHRIILVASAVAGEGKTTLAANLATSLAAAGRKTLLIDFDLRRPMLHNVYGIELSPGVCELLSGSASLGELVQESPHDNLWVVPAGVRTERRLAKLTDNRVAALFEQLREQYEFVIVDGPPVLPVVDARLIARHVDGVLFSLLRDVSEVPKVRSAYELLESYRAKILGGVIIGTTGDVYYSSIPNRSVAPATADAAS